MKKLKIKQKIGIFIIFAIILGYFSLFINQQGEYIIITQFGKPVRIIKEPGLYLKMPGFLNTINRFDAKMDIFKTNPVQMLLGDKNPIIITTFVVWAIDDPLLFFQALGVSELAINKLNDMINSEVSENLAFYNLDNIVHTDPENVKIKEIENRVRVSADEKARESYGIRIVNVGIRRINYPSIVADAVYNRMKAEREKEAKRIRAEGIEEATKIRAETDRLVSEILSQARKEAEIIKGEGDYKASLIIGEAYSQDREFFELIKTLEALERIINEKSVMVLSTDNFLFRILNNNE